MTRGLVLGGGGITGIAWETGLLAGLLDAGIDLTSADVVIGTSAGSVVGAQITSGTPLEELYERQLRPPEPGPVAAMGARVQFGYALAYLGSHGDLTRLGRSLGRLATNAARAGRTPTLDERLRVIEGRLPSPQWPDRDLRVTAVDAATGEFRVLTRADGVALRDAVAASCAVPGVYPPVPIEGRSYVDGGARSAANADLAAGCDRVIALTPIARVVPKLPSTQQHLDALGVPYALIAPDGASVAAIGRNLLDPAARAPSARAGRAQAVAEAERIRAVWAAS